MLCCPGYNQMFQRQAILDAGLIAGLNIVALMNEHAALTLQYGITKTGAPRFYFILGHILLLQSVSR